MYHNHKQTFKVTMMEIHQYPYKGTPASPTNSGDFKILKKAHDRAFKQKYTIQCRVCNKNAATVYWKFSGNKNDPNKTCNVCEKCYSFFFD